MNLKKIGTAQVPGISGSMNLFDLGSWTKLILGGVMIIAALGVSYWIYNKIRAKTPVSNITEDW